MSEMKVPEGYKQTEIGVIPEDWKVTTIGDFAPLQRGFDLPTTKVEAGDYPVVYSNGIVRNHKDFQVKGAGIVTGRSGTIGKVHYIESDFWPHNTTLWVTSFGDAHVKFVYYLFKYIGFERFKSGSGVPTLNRNDAHSFKTTVPTKVDEQTAIATALSDVDNLIQSLEKLIAKKEAIKTGAMQQLLTGKTRLPEFATREDGSAKGFKQTELGRIPEDWDFIRLPKVAWFQEGPGVRNNQFESYGVKLLNGTNIDKGRLLLDKTERYISEKLAYGQYSHFMIDNLDILIACSGVSIDRFDEKVTIVNDKHLPLCLNTSTMRFKPNNEKLYRFYLFYFLKSSLFKKQIGGTATGSAQLNFGPFHVNKVIIFLPSTKEQTAIATILSDIDTEIQALQQRLEKTKDIKQGMMQQLLTGKVRLAH